MRFPASCAMRVVALQHAPRTHRLDIKPEQLVPQLPKPRDLQPFPTTLAVVYKGHTGCVNSVAPDPWVGQWLLSGGNDGTMRLWEVRSHCGVWGKKGRGQRSWCRSACTRDFKHLGCTGLSWTLMAGDPAPPWLPTT